MGRVEVAELENHRHQLATDVRNPVEKYRAILASDVPEVDHAAADRLILGATPQAMDRLEHRVGP